MEVATTVTQRFAEAVAKRDEAAALGCAREWHGDRDGPARLYNQLVGAPVGLEVVGAAQVGSAGRAAQVVAITQGGQRVDHLTLLGEGEPFLITGVATKATHVESFLAGHAPAVLAWDELAPDPMAHAAAEALARTLARGAAGEADASDALGEAMSSAPGATVVIGYLAHAASRGGALEVVDARGLPSLGRAVVSAQIVIAGSEPELLFLYVDHLAGAVQWRAWTPYFSGDKLLAR